MKTDDLINKHSNMTNQTIRRDISIVCKDNSNIMNEYKEIEKNRIDDFISSVIEPLRQMNKLQNTKIVWYYELFKEKLECEKIMKEDNHTDMSMINTIETLFYEKTPKEIVDNFSGTYIATCFYILCGYYKKEILKVRYEKIYKDRDIIESIFLAQDPKYEDIMKFNIFTHPESGELLKKLNGVIRFRL